MAAVGLHQVLGHIAYAQAPVAVVVGATLVQLLAAVAAGADACGDMPLVTLEPVRDVFYVYGLVLHLYGFLNRDDVHSYSGSAHRDHRGNLLQRKESHSLEEHTQFRVTVHQFRIHIGILR